MKTVPAWLPIGWPMSMPTRPFPGARLLAELTRALEAERRYHALKHGGVAAAGIPRRIFEEFYGDWPSGGS